MFGIEILGRDVDGLRSGIDYAVLDRRKRVLAYGFTLHRRRYVAFPWLPWLTT